MYDETLIDNALIAMKDELYGVAAHLNTETDEMPVIRMEIHKLDDVCGKLELVRGLWKVLRYSYKGREISQRLADAAHCWMMTMAQSGKCHNTSLLLQTWERADALRRAYHADEHETKAA